MTRDEIEQLEQLLPQDKIGLLAAQVLLATAADIVESRLNDLYRAEIAELQRQLAEAPPRQPPTAEEIEAQQARLLAEAARANRERLAYRPANVG